MTSIFNKIVAAIKNLTQGRLADEVSVDNNAFFSTMSNQSWVRAIQLWRKHSDDILQQLPLRPCPACGENDSRLIHTSYDAHPFHVCKNCLCWFEPYLIDENVFQKLFSLSPEAEKLAQEMAQERLDIGYENDSKRFRELLLILPFFGKGTLLDIGANAGQFVKQARKDGWNAWGLEKDVFALQQARENKLPVIADFNELPNKKWDAITLWETIEHVADPLALLSFAKSMLADNGIMAFTFPNRNNFQLQQMRGDSPHAHGGYNTPGHINFFGKSQFEKLLSRVGMRAIYWDGFYASDYSLQWSYLHGSVDNLAEQSELFTVEFPALLLKFTESLNLLERKTLTSPILLCLACRADARLKAVAPKIDKLHTARQAQLDLWEQALLRSTQPLPFTVQFAVNSPGAYKVMICADNISSVDVGILIHKIDLRNENGKIVWQGMNDLLLHTHDFYSKSKKINDSCVILFANNVRYDYLLNSSHLHLPAGQYTLSLEGYSTIGRAAVGIIDVATGAWFVPSCAIPYNFDPSEVYKACLEK